MFVDETQHETDAKRSENRFHRIFAHIILAVLSKRPPTLFGFVKYRAGFFSIIFRHWRRWFQVFGRVPCLFAMCPLFRALLPPTLLPIISSLAIVLPYLRFEILPGSGAAQISSLVNAARAIRALTIKSSARVRLACDARNDAPRLWAANVCGLVAAGGREWHGHPLFSCAHENHAGVCAFVLMPDRCVSFAHGKRGRER